MLGLGASDRPRSVRYRNTGRRERRIARNVPLHHGNAPTSQASRSQRRNGAPGDPAPRSQKWRCSPYGPVTLIVTFVVPTAPSRPSTIIQYLPGGALFADAKLAPFARTVLFVPLGVHVENWTICTSRLVLVSAIEISFVVVWPSPYNRSWPDWLKAQPA
jgi:hypothetical protein